MTFVISIFETSNEQYSVACLENPFILYIYDIHIHTRRPFSRRLLSDKSLAIS